MRYPFQSTGRPISHRNRWSFRVYMIPLRDFVPEWNSRPGTRTGVNSRRGDSRRYDSLWWYHVNKYRAMRENRSELAPKRKSPRCHVNTPLYRVKKTVGERREPTLGVHFGEASRLINKVAVNKHATKERGQYIKPKTEPFPAGQTREIPSGQDGPFLLAWVATNAGFALFGLLVDSAI